MIRTALRAGLGALAMAVSLALVAPSAQAAPPPPSPPSSSRSVSNGHYVTLSKGETEAIKLARKATLKAESGRKIDWKKAKKVFGSHTSLREGSGAGCWSRRGDWEQFRNITKTDKKKIIAWANNHPGPNPQMRAMRPKACTGVTKTTSSPAWLTIQWYNSCDTNNVKALLDVCMPVRWPDCRHRARRV